MSATAGCPRPTGSAITCDQSSLPTINRAGDGCGLLMKRPDRFLRAIAGDAGINLGALYASGIIFLNQNPALAATARDGLTAAIRNQGLELAGWRQVPTDSRACGDEALKTLPLINQIFVNAAQGTEGDVFERQLFVARRRAEQAINAQDESFYVPTLSARVFSFKGLVLPKNLPAFYRDLENPRLATSVCLFHQRFSTNTWPQWRLAQPFRLLAHNAEINTIRGNRLWAQARTPDLASPALAHMAPLVRRVRHGS